MLHAENSAVGFYRIIQPARAIADNKLARVITLPFNPGESLASVQISELEKVIKWANVALFSRLDNPASLAVMKAIKGTYHIPVLMELDDLPMELNEDSWAFEQYRRDRPFTEYNDPVLWAIEQIKASDGIIVTNKYLEARITKLLPQTALVRNSIGRKVHIIPNTIDTEKLKPVFKEKKDTITIGWQGGSNHKFDLEQAREGILAILKEFPNVHFKTFGYNPEWAKKNKQCEHKEWVNFDQYYDTLPALGFDIGIAPLVDNSFNRCKSNLRWLEYSALQIPTILSSVGPYLSVKHNYNGFLASNEHDWYIQLKHLIQHPKKRQFLAKNAYKSITTLYNPKRWAKQYVRIFNYYATQYARSGRKIFNKRSTRYSVNSV